MTPPVRNGAPVNPRRRVAAGRVAAMFDQHASMVLGLCRLLLRDHHEAEDAAQQTFVSAYRSLLRGTEPRDAAPWLAAIARNECRARIRQRMRGPVALESEVEERLSDLSPDLAEQTDRRAELAALTAAIAELPARQREAVALRDFLGLSYEEVASTLSVSVPVVESLLFRARRRLRDSVRTVPRYAAGLVAFPFAIRAAFWRDMPDFDSAGQAGLIGAAGTVVAGAVAKVVSLPFATKAATAVAVVAAATVAPNLGGPGHGQLQKGSGGQAASPAQQSAGAQSTGGTQGLEAAGTGSGVQGASGRPSGSDQSGTVGDSAASGSVLVSDSAGSSRKHHQRKHHRQPQGDVAQQPTRDIVSAGAGQIGSSAGPAPSATAPPPVIGDTSAPPTPSAGSGDPSTPVIGDTSGPVIGAPPADITPTPPASDGGGESGAPPVIGDTGASTAATG